MKYIRLFESYNDTLLQDIKDIMLEASDDGYDIYVGITTDDTITVSIEGIESEYSVSGGRDYNAFDTKIFKEYDLRIKDYLGDRLIFNYYLLNVREYGTARTNEYPNEWTNELIFKYEIY